MTTKETGYPALDYLGTFDTYQGYTANQMGKETTIVNEDKNLYYLVYGKH